MTINKNLIIYLPGYKTDINVSSIIRNVALKLNYKFLRINYSDELGNTFFDIEKIIDKVLIRINKTLEKHSFEKVILIGYSFGAAIAVEIAINGFFNKLVLISVFDDRKSFLKKRKIKITCRENISPVKKIKQIKIPIVFIHGNKDLSINLERSKKVFKKSNDKSIFLEINADHYFKQKLQKNQLYNQLLDQLQ
jgi:alpha/beta superfamily hydrolase